MTGLVVVPAGVLAGALIQRVILVGPVLYRRDTLRWRQPLAAGDLEEVTLHRENTGRFDYHLVLALHPYGRVPAARFSLRWWHDWRRLIGWLVAHCTALEDGQLVWTVKTDETTRSRLQPIAQPYLERQRPIG